MASPANSPEPLELGFPLNPEQRAAVEHGDGPLLVVAGAGTGKTRVITERIRHLLESNPELAGENILGLTFTDKAANEMKRRVVSAIGERAEGVWLSTFHKFCLEKILRAANTEVQPLDDLEHKILLRRNIARLQLKHFKRLQEPSEFLADFVTFFSRCQDELVTPDDYRGFVAKQRSDFDTQGPWLDDEQRAIQLAEIEKQEELARAFAVSEQLLREQNLTTFGAQLADAVAVLRADQEKLRKAREQYRYILVDEFQDTNVAQIELLWLLAGGRRNLMAVGDHHQAIYRFRGASYGSFTIFLERFCGMHEPVRGAKYPKFVVSLSQNYRSTKRILNVADAVIRNNEQSPLLPANRLITENREGEKIRVAEFATPQEEAHWVAAEIERVHAAGARWSTMAVLYRKHLHRDVLLGALQRRGIPFVIRRLSILSSTIVRDLLAWLRVIGRPGDNIATARVLAAPHWGLQAHDLVRLVQRADKNHGRPLSDEITSRESEAEFPRLKELADLLASLRRSAHGKGISELLDELIAALGIAPLSSDEDRYYLERFAGFVRDWERKNPEGHKLRDFLEYLFYFNEARGDITLEDHPAEDAVELMTVHAAKGLEFPYVFVMRLSKADFPTFARPAVFEFPAELMKEEKPEGDFHIQEERRLFYVALTRARQRLTLSTVVNKRKRQSPFLDDFLEDAKVKKFDSQQLSPRVILPPDEEAAGPTPIATESLNLFDALRDDARAYSRIALWSKAHHPPRSEPLQLSPSAISAYQACPMKYQFQYLWGIRGGPHAQATFGRVMHTTIQEFVCEVRERGGAPLEKALAIYDREWSSAGFSDDYDEEEYRKTGREQLEAFHGKYMASPPEVVHQEKEFDLAFEDGIVVSGRIDQINRIREGQFEIVDYKTGKPKDLKKSGDDIQLSIYAIAAREALGFEATRLVFYNLQTNEAVETTRDAKALAATKQKIREVADLIRAKEFAPNPSYGCATCDYKPICPAHERLISIRPAVRN